MAQMYHLVADT